MFEIVLFVINQTTTEHPVHVSVKAQEDLHGTSGKNKDHIPVQVSTFRLVYPSTSPIFATERILIPIYCWSRIYWIAWFYAFYTPVFKTFL